MRQQAELFPRVVKSIEYNQDNILSDILMLHAPNGVIDLDPTFSIGHLYQGKIPEPRLKFDIEPERQDVRQSDCRDLPLQDDSLDCIMFDPPFIINSDTKSKDKMQLRFDAFRSADELVAMYEQSLVEFLRILSKGGILIFKCQDVCHGKLQYFTHCKVYELAIHAGFQAKDLFIYFAKQRIIGKHKRQMHSRKFHSYFWVFRKPKRKAKTILL